MRPIRNDKKPQHFIATGLFQPLEFAMHIERRQKPRLHDPIPLIVQGSDENGRKYRFDTITRDVGSEGLCALAPRIMKKGETVSLRMRFSVAGSKPVQAPSVAASAVVLRVEEQPDESSLFAVSFLSRRVLFSQRGSSARP